MKQMRQFSTYLDEYERVSAQLARLPLWRRLRERKLLAKLRQLNDKQMDSLPQ